MLFLPILLILADKHTFDLRDRGRNLVGDTRFLSRLNPPK
jgi:hypothetical protein